MSNVRTPLSPLAEYVSGLRVAAIPPEFVELAKLKILDSLACAYLGAESDYTRVAKKYAARLPAGACTDVLGARSLQPADAAFVNSVAVHSILQDDVDLTIGHPACNVIPSALAAAEQVNASGADVVAAIVAGYETMWRVGGRSAFMIPTIARGFRGNTLLAAFGSAAASARVMKLDAAQTLSAIGAAASFTAGLLKPLNDGTMERPFQQAANTQQGMMAAMLAADGLHGCASVLEGFGGLYQSFMGADAFPADALVSLGKEFHFPETFCKPYPSAGSNTVGLAVLHKLLAANPRPIGDIQRMRVEVVPRFTGKPGYPAIANPGPFATLEHALISFPFGLACMAAFGDVTLATLRSALVDPRVAKLAGIIELEGVEVPYPLWCRITVTDAQGRTHVTTSEEIDWKEFYLDRPTASRKFLAAAAPVLPAEAAASAVEHLLRLEHCANLHEVSRALRARIGSRPPSSPSEGKLQ